jgi:hypothetical protein
MVAIEAVSAMQSGRQKLHCGEDDTQPHASECGDAHPNLGSRSELGDAF